MFVDQTLEQEIKMMKQHGGLVELTQDEAEFDRLLTILHLVRQFLNTFPKISKSGVQSEHYQLYGTIVMKIGEKSEKIKESFEIHFEGKTFTKKKPIEEHGFISSDDAKGNILHYKESGQICFEFIKDRLLLSSKLSI